MPIFSYQAIDHQGNLQEGELESITEEDVAHYLQKKEMLLVSLKLKKEESAFQKGKRWGGSLSLLDRQILFEDLWTMVAAGLPIADSLKMLREDAEKEITRRILMDFQFTIEKGEPLSSAIEHYPHFFSPVVINIIKAGEASGNLEKSLKLMASQFRKDNDLKRKITGAMIYPAILLGLSIGVIIFLLIFVVPKLAQFFAQANLELPLMTKIVIGLGNLLSGSLLFDIVILFAVIGFFIFLKKSQKGKHVLITLVARFPLTKKLFRQLSMYRYCWTMEVLLSSGVGILESIEITSKVLVGKQYKDGLERIKEKVSKGTSLGDAMRDETNLFPRMVSGLTAVGEKTGSLENIYHSLSTFYDRNFGAALKAGVTMIEPLMLLVMGFVVGGIALSVVLPIYKFVSGVT